MAFILSIYLVLHLCIGLVLPRRQGFKPYFFRLMENIGLELERRLNRTTRPQSIRFMRGTIIAAILGLIGVLIGGLVQDAARLPYGWAAIFIFLSLCINFMTPLKLVRYIIRALNNNELQKATEAVRPYLKESLEKADAHTVIRKTIEFIALSLNQFLLAPAFWFLIAGPLGLSIYVTFAALQQAFGLPDEQRRYFGSFVRLVDMLLNIVPAFLTAVLLSISALFVSKSNPLQALAVIFQAARRYYIPYPYWPVAALAGGLGVTLGGPILYDSGYTEERPWIGPAGSSARLSSADLSRAILLQYVFFAMLLGMVSGIIILKI